jgi:hypothetical protein
MGFFEVRAALRDRFAETKGILDEKEGLSHGCLHDRNRFCGNGGKSER